MQVVVRYAWAVPEDTGWRAKAGETKKRRTYERLIRAADTVMRREGMVATVESIARGAGLSVPTFYNFFVSRNHLCAEAYRHLVLQEMYKTFGQQNFVEQMRTYAQLTTDRTDLVRASQIFLLEAPALHIPTAMRDRSWLDLPQIPQLYLRIEVPTMGPEGFGFSSALGYLLADAHLEARATPTEKDPQANVRVALMLNMVARTLEEASAAKPIEKGLILGLVDIVAKATMPVD